MTISPYNLFYMESFRSSTEFWNTAQYDLFISAYTNEDIVLDTYKNINANEKLWLIFSEYDLNLAEIDGEKFNPSLKDETTKEADYIRGVYEDYIVKNIDKKICIDITGFNKPYLIYMIIYLKEMDTIKKIDLIYTEPQQYVKGTKTVFSRDSIKSRDIVTFDESFPSRGENDLFIVNVGYDFRLVKGVLEGRHAKIKPLLGFPSLQPIMYQENILNLIKSKNELGINENEELLYAPANHPFITAQVVSEYINAYTKKYGLDEIKNIYLSPLATKAQTIGMTLFYIFEKEKYKKEDISIHIRYPFTNKYSSSSSKGVFRINKYTIEFDLFDNLH